MITLRRLHAEHFKGLQMVDLIFPEQGSILIEGHNEAGKSTLFEAVYVALYGEPLVGEESRPRLEEVIQHGQPQALVELNFAVGVEELTVRRILRRDQPQRAWLTIHRPDGSEETVTRPTTVNRRILQEFNNLDGDNLRNSCFVEQKELGRLEEMNSSKREQAIQSLLGLERLAKLSDQFKFKREQELDLDHTRRLLELAQVQQEVRTLEAEERALAERLDATRIFAHLAEYATLETERSTIQERFAARERHETDLRGSLDRAGRIRGQLSACGDVQQQLERAVAQRVDVERLSGKLAELYDVEHEAMPETRAKLDKTLLALKLVIDAEQTRETAQRAAVAVHDAQRAVEALERANEVVRQRVESLHAARARADQHRQDAESSRRQQQAHLAELVARQTRLHRALERVTLWEQQCATLEDIRREMQGTDQKARALADLRAVLRQREETAHQAADATASAERERQQAEAHRRQAEGRVALRDWLRLKEVDASLSGFARDRATLEDERGKAADALLRAQGQTRGSLVAAAATTLVAVLMFAASAAWTWVAIVGGILAIAAVLLWVGYRRAHARMGASKKAADSVENQLRDLATQYQAAVRAGGDPALLGQRERELAAAGFEVPSSLEAARAMLRRMPSEDAFDYQRARAAADDAMATLARLKAEAERAQADAGQTREALRALEAQGDAATLLRDLRAREVAQRETVEAAEADARDAVVANLSWPANSAHVQTAIAACQAEQRAVERGMAAAETTMANGARDDASLLAQAEQALKTAEDAAAALRTPDPLEQLAQILAHLVRTEELAGEVGTRARLAAQDIGLAPNRAAVEAERGRLEERLHILEGQLISRPALDAELADAQTSYTNTLESADTALRAIVESAASLATAAIRPASPVGNQRADERQLASRLGEVRAALESALATLHEVDAQAQLEDSLHEKGTLTQRMQAIERQLAALAEDMSLMLTARHLPMLSQHTPAALAAVWPLTGKVSAGDLDRVQSDLAQARNRLFATREREQRLAEELHHPGTALEIEECRRRVRELEEERALCQRAMRMIQDARDRIAREVLPTTERNMQLLLPELTAHRYWDVRLTPPDGEEGQLSQLDYRIRVWDQTAGRYVAKNLFSGGTRDQCSLALRLAFALATLPQELGVAPGFIFLDEPLSAFDVQRAQALVDLLTTGIIAQQFAQVVVISHQHAFDRRAFQYHIRMEGGQVVESDLPGARERASQPVRVRVATAP